VDTLEYDPFASGPFPIGVCTIHALDPARNRLFPCEIWYPAMDPSGDAPPGPEEIRDAVPQPGPHPLILYSHSSGNDRRSSSFLCTHLAGHGYVVAALDHSERIAPELARRDGETDADRAARIQAIITARVPDIRFLLDCLINSAPNIAPKDTPDNGAADIQLDPARVGLVGYSFGGWTVLAATEVEPRVQSVVAMGPGGSSHPRPGILPLTLTFAWGRDVPTLFLAAENDESIPLDGVIELFQRTPSTKRLFILRCADHQHFLDDVEGAHEAIRAMTLPGDIAWLPAAMRPIAELCSGEEAHVFARGLTLAHLDATLRESSAAERLLTGDVEAALAAQGVDAIAYRP
jgi:predicted dienelactone hydrolase